jgi:hypothetical protein
MNLGKFTRFILACFRNPELWNLPEPRDMATPQESRHKKAKPRTFHRPFFSRAFLILTLMLLASGLTSRAMACAACFGQSDSEMAKGLNAGILFLFVIVAGVLGTFAAFFIYLAKRSARMRAASAARSQDPEDPFTVGADAELFSSPRWETTR